MPSASPAPMFIIKEVLPVMKTTGDLMKALSFPEISPEDYLSANKEELLNSSPKELWTSLVERSRQSFPTVRKFYSYMDTDLYIPAFSEMSC